MTALDPTATYRQEARELLEQLEEALLDLENKPADHALVDKAFRALHTIKGSGAMFGFDDVAAFTHHLESAFEGVRSGNYAATPELIGLTLSSLDHIRLLIEAPDQADAETGAAALRALEQLVGAGPSDDATSKRTIQDGAGDVERRWRISFSFDENVMAFGTNPLLLLGELRGLGQCKVIGSADAVPPLSEMNPVGCYASWNVELVTSCPRENIEDVFIFVVDETRLSIEEIFDDEMESELASPVRSVASVQERPASLAAPKVALSDGQSSIRVQAERLDALMDQVGELVIAQARLRQLSSSANPQLQAVSEDIERLISELRDTTMSIRMLPIGTLFGRFRRVVRDLSQSLGKEVVLTMDGEETELDKTVIESLADPLVHLIRNAIDHGLEDAAERRRLGKPVAGSVHLAAVHSGAQVLITVTDDGRGMNRAAIKVKAEERGLLEPGTEIADADLLALVLEPGFSTAHEISSVSGRGVGMDVVHQTVDGLRGSIAITSTEGSGSAVTLKLPLTLAIIDGLLVQVGGGQYVIPLAAVEECVDLTPAEDLRSANRSFLNLRGDIVPFLRLRELFAIQGRIDGFQKVVIVNAGGLRVGLVVDHVIGQYQTVIKSLSRLLDDVEQFSGATILGDGTVALILDIPHLIDYAQMRENTLKAS